MNPNAKAPAPAFSDVGAGTPSLSPPLARREPVETIVHDDRRVDHYAWLRQKENPEVIAYLEAENAYTDAILKPTEKFHDALYQEMLGRILQTDLSAPYRCVATNILRARSRANSIRFIAAESMRAGRWTKCFWI